MEKIDKLCLIKIKNVCSSKNNIKKIKKKPQTGGNSWMTEEKKKKTFTSQ